MSARRSNSRTQSFPHIIAAIFWASDHPIRGLDAHSSLLGHHRRVPIEVFYKHHADDCMKVMYKSIFCNTHPALDAPLARLTVATKTHGHQDIRAHQDMKLLLFMAHSQAAVLEHSYVVPKEIRKENPPFRLLFFRFS